MSAQKTDMTATFSRNPQCNAKFDAAGLGFRLTCIQEAAVNLLAIGYTSSDVSSVLRVSRSTLNFWSNHVPQFRAELEVLQEQLAEDKVL
jgi:hypothetical protein